ncbi:MAG: hypothetical protein AAF716_10855 [Cyanobacteria bacterium P01_D01_bin.1]
MPYSQFSIESIQSDLGVRVQDRSGLFAEVAAIPYSDFLAQSLKEYSPLAIAIGTEKSRSEFIIAPILFELKKQLANQISLFSGKEFNVEPTKGLSGFCDFLISRSPEQLFIKSPVVTIVEAKNDNILTGIGQCIAEMVAAQIFNERHQNSILVIYGVVTTGSLWKFLRLEGALVQVDLDEYYLNDIGKLLGILRYCVV